MAQRAVMPRWRVLGSAEAVRDAALERIQSAAAEALARSGAFHLVLAGGTTPQKVYEALRGMPAQWDKWHVWFGDERCLPVDHPERNSCMAREAWLNHVAIPAGQIHAIPAELGAEPGAAAYAETLREVGEFDLVLLGLGEDGHTASLFPGQQWGCASDAPAALAVHQAPKPPADRISLSAKRLSRAYQVLFLVSGKSKSGAVERWRKGEGIPATAIVPPGGVDVLVDGAAFAVY